MHDPFDSVSLRRLGRHICHRLKKALPDGSSGGMWITSTGRLGAAGYIRSTQNHTLRPLMLRLFFLLFVGLCLVILPSSPVAAVTGVALEGEAYAAASDFGCSKPSVAADRSNSSLSGTRSGLSRREKRVTRRRARITKRIYRYHDRQQPKGRPPRKGGRGSGLAVASLVLGIVGVLTLGYLIPSILAVIFGAISLKRYREGYHDRKKMALAGLILGIVGVAAALVILGILFVFW